VKVGANGEVETVEQEEGGIETHPMEEEEEEEHEVGEVLEGEDEPVQLQNDDSAWSKDPDYQPPSAILKKSKKVAFGGTMTRWDLKLTVVWCIALFTGCFSGGLSRIKRVACATRRAIRTWTSAFMTLRRSSRKGFCLRSTLRRWWAT